MKTNIKKYNSMFFATDPYRLVMYYFKRNYNFVAPYVSADGYKEIKINEKAKLICEISQGKILNNKIYGLTVLIAKVYKNNLILTRAKNFTKAFNTKSELFKFLEQIESVIKKKKGLKNEEI